MIAATAVHSETDLAAWLAANGIDTAVWGREGAKTVADLWEELRQGESTLEEDPPQRAVTVVQVTVRREDAELLELAQELRDRQIRARNRPPSEKMKAGEEPRPAALRCLLEELGLATESVDSLSLSAEPQVIIADSPSYPGLTTRFTIYSAEAEVRGLPATDFWRDNVGAGESDPVVRHLWGWRTP